MSGRGARRTAVRLLVVVVVVSAVVPATAAAETEVGVSVVVERGETVGDLTAAAGSVLVLGTVDGDVTALAGNVVVTGEVTGDVTAIGGNVEVAGDVGGRVTTFAVNAGVDGRVEGGLDAIVGYLSVGGTIRGPVDATGVFVAVEPDGRLEGRLVTTAYETTVDGTVVGARDANADGDATAPENGTANATASDDSSSNAFGSTAGPPAAGVPVARIAGGGMDGPPAQLVSLGGRGGGVSILDAYGFLVNLLLGAILVGFLPNFSNRVASMITQSPVRTAASGAAVLLAAPVVFLVLGLSLFGLPIALAGVVLYVVVGWVGTAYGRFALGTWLFVLAARGLALADVETEPVRNRWARLFVGYLAVALLIRIPYLGVAVDTVVVALGIGALATLVFEGYVRNERSPATAGDAGSEPAD